VEDGAWRNVYRAMRSADEGMRPGATTCGKNFSLRESIMGSRTEIRDMSMIQITVITQRS